MNSRKSAHVSEDASLGEHAGDALGDQLKETYGRLLKDPVPQKFLDLLQQLDSGADANADNKVSQNASDDGKDS